MFKELQNINLRPKPYEFYTAEELWADPYTSRKMLDYHLNPAVDVASRRKAFIKKSVQWITSNFKLAAGRRVIDFGCGPGLYTTQLAKNKAIVTGIDFSENSLKYARKTAIEKNLEINYVHQNYLDFDTDERFDLIIMIMCDFCALSPDQRRRLLDKFHTLLVPGGAVLLDVYSLSSFETRQEESIFKENLLDEFWAPGQYFCFCNTFKYYNEKVVLDKYTIVEAHRIRTIYNWLQYFSPEALEKDFSRSGLSIKAFYSDVAGQPFKIKSGEFAVVAKKI